MSTTRIHLWGLSAIFWALVSASDTPAEAQALVSTGESFVSARFLPGIPETDGRRTAGLRLTLENGWKTYWRSPGEAGIPPRFDWSASQNLHSAEVLWPRPTIYMSFGMETIGYSEQVILPIKLTPIDPSQPIQIAATVDLGVCRELCVLERFSFADTILPETPSIGTSQIKTAMSRVPPPATDVGLIRAECTLSGTGATRDLNVGLVFEQPLEQPVVLFESTEHVWINQAKTVQQPDQIRAAAKLSLTSASAWFDRGSLRMTLLAKDFSADIRGCTAPQG